MRIVGRCSGKLGASGAPGRHNCARASGGCLSRRRPRRAFPISILLFFFASDGPRSISFSLRDVLDAPPGPAQEKTKKTITPVLFGHVGREKIFCREIVTIAGELDDNRNPRSGSLGLFPEPVLISALFSTPLSTFAHIKLELGPRIIPRAIGKMPSEIIYNVISELFRFSHIIPATVYFPQTSKFASEKDFSELFFS